MPAISILALTTSLLVAPPVPGITVIAPQAAFPAIRVSDRELATMRGGMLLPDGLDISVGIDIQTRLNGALILHTVYSSDGPNAGIRVYTDGTHSPSTTPATVSVNTATAIATPTIIVDRSPTGTVVAAQTQNVPVNINLLQAAPATWLDGSGQNAVALTANGPAVAADGNDIKLTSDAQGAVVTLNGPGLEVQHLVGQATGVVVANTASNRVIDTLSSINVDLQGISPALMSGIFAANRIATEAIQSRPL